MQRPPYTARLAAFYPYLAVVSCPKYDGTNGKWFFICYCYCMFSVLPLFKLGGFKSFIVLNRFPNHQPFTLATAF